MAPKSSDGDVTDGTGSSSDLDMETSLGVALSLMGKCRAETDDSGESEQTADEDRLDEDSEGEENELDEDSDELDEEDDEDGVEENELDEDSDELDEEEGDEGESYRRNEENREPEWGYDSFEGREYDSPNLGDYSDKEFVEQCRHYKRQLIETKGFFEASDKFPPYVYTPGIASLGDLDEPAMLGLTIREACEKLATICLQRYNEDEEKNVKLDHILRANYNPGSMTKFYITFAARETESPDAPLVEYQAKAVWSVLHVIYPILCRPSPAPKRAMEENM